MKLLLLILAAGTVAASAQDTGSAPLVKDEPASNPVAEVRNARSWEYGPFFNWGTGVGDRDNFKFFWIGAQLGKPLTPVLHAGILSGQFELRTS